MALKLSTQLERLINKSDISKNMIIKYTGIDRSTFYQILSDKRIPTESVFSSLLHFFMDFNQKDSSVITQSDLDRLMKAYLNETLDKDKLITWKTASSFIRKANSSLVLINSTVSSDSDNETDQKVSDFLSRQLEVHHNTIDYYMPTDLIRRYHILDFLRQAIPYNIHINQLCGIYENRHQKISEKLLNALADTIVFLNYQPENYNVYCFSDSTFGKQNLLYPYYMVGKNEALFISADGKHIIHMDDADAIEDLHRYISDIISRSYSLFTHVDDYMELAKNLLHSYYAGSASVIYSVAERPCFWEIVTPDIIQKYSPDQNTERFALNYAKVLKSLSEFYGLNSFEGLKAFELDHCVSEAGLDLKLDETDMTQLQNNLNDTIWKHILFLPFSNCFIHNWEIAIYYPDTVYLSLYDNPKSALCIKDHNIIDPLFTYYDTMFHLLCKQEKKK